VSITGQLIDAEQKALIGHKDKYNHAVFFKSSKPKKLSRAITRKTTSCPMRVVIAALLSPWTDAIILRQANIRSRSGWISFGKGVTSEHR
jgi:hypothetical protein